MLLHLIDHGGVVERGAVAGEIDGLGLLGEGGKLAAGVVVTFLEGLEGGGGGAFEAEGAGDVGPVDFRGYGALGEEMVSISVDN